MNLCRSDGASFINYVEVMRDFTPPTHPPFLSSPNLPYATLLHPILPVSPCLPNSPNFPYLQQNTTPSLYRLTLLFPSPLPFSPLPPPLYPFQLPYTLLFSLPLPPLSTSIPTPFSTPPLSPSPSDDVIYERSLLTLLTRQRAIWRKLRHKLPRRNHANNFAQQNTL